MTVRRGSDPGANPKETGKTAPIWVKILVGFHVLVTIVWALPNLDGKYMRGELKPQATQWLLYWNQAHLKPLTGVQSYLFTTGTWQYWDMFAPDPANTDWYCTAEVTYRDGTKRSVVYPRIADLTIPMKYVKERYRKFFERAHNEYEPMLWPSFARAMILRDGIDPANPPVQVVLTAHSLQVAAPGAPQETAYRSVDYYTYIVEEKWLKRVTNR